MNTLEILPANNLKAHNHELKIMGCRFGLTAVHANADLAWNAMLAGVAEIERIEKLISSWRTDSQTSEINRMAGVAPVKVDSELYQLIKRSLKVSHLTRGAFDISGTLARDFWKFTKTESIRPSDKILAYLKDRINYHHIILDDLEQSVFLKLKGMKIGFGAIGKGYAAYRAKVIMESRGIENGLVNASGDLMAWGQPADAETWEIKIRDPINLDYVLAKLNINNNAIVTSGEAESYALIDGKRYSHIVDPRTGWPVEGLKLVSVICPNPELGDALATAISVLGATDGLALVNRMNGVECILLTHENQLLSSNQLQVINL